MSLFSRWIGILRLPAQFTRQFCSSCASTSFQRNRTVFPIFRNGTRPRRIHSSRVRVLILRRSAASDFSRISSAFVTPARHNVLVDSFLISPPINTSLFAITTSLLATYSTSARPYPTSGILPLFGRRFPGKRFFCPVLKLLICYLSAEYLFFSGNDLRSAFRLLVLPAFSFSFPI